MESVLLPFDGCQLTGRLYGHDFLLIESAEEVNLSVLGESIFRRQLAFVEEVIVTEAELCLTFNALFTPEKLRQLTSLTSKAITAGKTYSLPIFFADTEDWPLVTAACGKSKVEIISELSQVEFSVAMFGFLPGFLYLNGLPQHLQLPRKRVPAKYVSANSIAIGGKYLGVYAVDSPGGWYVLGESPVSFLQGQLPPSPFRLGDTIRWEAIDEATYQQLLAQPKKISAWLV